MSADIENEKPDDDAHPSLDEGAEPTDLTRGMQRQLGSYIPPSDEIPPPPPPPPPPPDSDPEPPSKEG